MTDPALRRLAASVVLPGFVGTTVPEWLRRELDAGLAGVCLFGQNVVDDVQVRALTGALHDVRDGVLVTADEEGGSVTRLESDAGSRWPGAAALGALDDVVATEQVARGLGAQARAAGIDVVLGPVADVNSEPDNPVIGERSFGADPALVGRHVASSVRGLQSAGVAACAKHFPGHGATRVDSHLSLPRVDADEATYRARDLAPFADAVAAGTRCVMTAHVVVSALDDRPATTSPRVLGLLRDDLGFDGVIVSDALDMGAMPRREDAAVAALAAGVDLLCIGNPVFPDGYDDEAAARSVVDALVAAVRSGDVAGERLEQAAARVASLAVPGAALGADVAHRALTVTGDVALAPGAVALLAPTEVGIAAGRRPSRLAPLLGAVEVPDANAVPALLDRAAGRDVAVVVEGRSGPATRKVVEAVLAARSDAVVVHVGPADHDGPTAARSVVTHAGGLAAAWAAADALGVAR
ncbi:glycoside hydrolase family 3 protein [Nocardioides marinquilinus]|uniref:Glycoside hydrolase family 3 protein n=1 Tax=Nocardioides marinquilinus TaxID=1210400 RepID=A0ABP9PPN7_9ACTN